MSREQILLVALNAKYIHSNPAVYSLAAYANQITDNVSIAEFTINDRYEDILGGILMRKPEVIGFSIYIWNVELMKQLIEDIHKISPKIRLMAGGPEATNDPETYLEWCELV
nr:cobalamin B12-binding domain-containing protein [Lachnospiraceae bacterium]